MYVLTTQLKSKTALLLLVKKSCHYSSRSNLATVMCQLTNHPHNFGFEFNFQFSVDTRVVIICNDSFAYILSVDLKYD